MALRLDWLAFECVEFEAELDELLVTLYKSASEKLREVNSVLLKRADEEIARSASEVEHDDAWLAKEWEAQQARERERILGGLTTAYLVAVFMARLRSLKQHFDKTHPPAPPYIGGSELDRLVSEYSQRFRVDLEKSPTEFSHFRELVLARNSFLHNEGVPSKDYFPKFPKPKYVDEEGKIWFSAEHFRETVETSKRYLVWLVEELMRFRDAGKQRG